MKIVFFTFYVLLNVFSPGCSDKKAVGKLAVTEPNMIEQGDPMSENKMELTEEQWENILTPLQFNILRKKGTERPFSGNYVKKPKTHLVYVCAGCGNKIFVSDDQFNSHCGWPSFTAPADPNSVQESSDTSLGMVRTEITCSTCGGHLGHVFNDGPGPNSLRYCINSAAMKAEKEK